MARHSVSPARRRRRIVLDALLLVIVLAALVFKLDFPIFTARQAMEATQARHLFGPGRVLLTLDRRQSGPTRHSRYYILQDGDWYAWCGVDYVRPFWYAGGLWAVENDPDLPLVPLVVDRTDNGLILVISNASEIVRTEVVFPASDEGDTGFYLLSADQVRRAENCFLFSYSMSGLCAHYPEDLQVRGYDAAGALVYQSPVPESWESRYELR